MLAELVRHYGLPGLFISSFIGSTIFVPFSAEVGVLALAVAGVDKLAILTVATAGSVAGTLVNYYIGYKGIGFAGRYVKKEEISKAEHTMNRYGWLGLFGVLVIPMPLPVDPLTILCGAGKMDVRIFIATVAAAKAVKYAIVLGLVTLVF